MRRKDFRFIGFVLALSSVIAMSACSRQTAEEKGRELATEKIDLVKGIGSALEAKGGGAAEAVAGGVGTVVKGLGKGMEKSGRTIVVAPSVEQAGLQITKVQEATAAGDRAAYHGLEVYIVANADAQGKLRVIVYDLLDKEIGRARVDLERAAEEGKYLAVPLDQQISLGSIAKVAFEFQSSPPAARKM